jgi:hypothetical protein
LTAIVTLNGPPNSHTSRPSAGARNRPRFLPPLPWYRRRRPSGRARGRSYDRIDPGSESPSTPIASRAVGVGGAGGSPRRPAGSDWGPSNARRRLSVRRGLGAAAPDSTSSPGGAARVHGPRADPSMELRTERDRVRRVRGALGRICPLDPVGPTRCHQLTFLVLPAPPAIKKPRSPSAPHPACTATPPGPGSRSASHAGLRRPDRCAPAVASGA